MSRINVVIKEGVIKRPDVEEPPQKKVKVGADENGNKDCVGKGKKYGKRRKQSVIPHPNTLAK